MSLQGTVDPLAHDSRLATVRVASPVSTRPHFSVPVGLSAMVTQRNLDHSSFTAAEPPQSLKDHGNWRKVDFRRSDLSPAIAPAIGGGYTVEHEVDKTGRRLVGRVKKSVAEPRPQARRQPRRPGGGAG